MQQYCLTQEQIILRDTVRKFAQNKVAPRAQEIDEKAQYPHDMFEWLIELGLFALPFPEEYGGADSVLSSCIVPQVSRSPS